MSVITNVKKTSSTVTGLFSLPAFDATEGKKPLFAVVGVADLAFEQVKEVPADVSAEAKRVQGLITEASKTVPAQFLTLPAQVKDLRSTVENKVNEATDKTTDFYAKLAVRGEKLVGQVRRQPSTQAAVAEGKAAVQKVESAAVAAKKSAKAGVKAAEDAAAAL